MSSKKKYNLPLDQFIHLSLYNKKFGYYMKKPFGEEAILLPHQTFQTFSEMIAIWIVSFWKSLGSPKKLNLIELGAGNGELMKIFIESFQKFPIFFNSCNFAIHEKSTFLKKIQKKDCPKKIVWLSKITALKNTHVYLLLMNFLMHFQ